MKSGENLVDIIVSFKNNGIRFTYKNDSYVDFEVESDEVLNVDFKDENTEFKYTLNKPK